MYMSSLISFNSFENFQIFEGFFYFNKLKMTVSWSNSIWKSFFLFLLKTHQQTKFFSVNGKETNVTWSTYLFNRKSIVKSVKKLWLFVGLILLLVSCRGCDKFAPFILFFFECAIVGIVNNTSQLSGDYFLL